MKTTLINSAMLIHNWSVSTSMRLNKILTLYI